MKSFSEHCRCVLFPHHGQFAQGCLLRYLHSGPQQLRKVQWKEAEPDNKVRLDLGDEERKKKKLEELTAESDPLTRLMNDIFGGKV